MATPTLSMQNYFSTTLSASATASDTVLYLTQLPTATEGYLEIDEGLSTKEIIYYTSKGPNFVTCPSVGAGRGVGGTTAAAHNLGGVVKQKINAEYWTELQNGNAFKPSYIKDSSNNELLKFSSTGSAVNELTVANAATAGAPQIAASGDDTNVFARLQGKGTGQFFPQLGIQTATITNTGTANAVAATLNFPSVPFATKVLLFGFASAALGSGAPTLSWVNYILRGSTTGGVAIATGDNTKSAAAAITETRTTTLMAVESVAASTAQAYVWVIGSTASTTTSGNFFGIQVAA